MDRSERHSVSAKEIKALLLRTRSPYIGERAQAEAEFRELGAEGIEALVGLVQSKTRTWQKRKRAYFLLVALFLCFAVPTLSYTLYQAIQEIYRGNWPGASRNLGMGLGGVLGGLGGGILGGFAWLLVAPTELIMSARLLSQVEDLRGIEPLVRVLGMQTADYELRHSAAKGLCRLLPRIDDTTSHHIGPEVRTMLAKYLLRSRPDREDELLTAIFSALSWTGDSETLRAFRQFGERVYTDPPSEYLLDAVRIATERLEARVEAARRGEHLLRPSGGTQPASNLLRPATAADSDEALLLRAGSDDSHQRS